jgi:hypothetical protein
MSVFGSFLKKIDFPIRYLYCRLPFISKTLFWKKYVSGIQIGFDHFQHINSVLEKNNFSLSNKTCLEIGPGNSLLFSLQALISGAKKIYLVDKYVRFTNSPKQTDFFSKEISFLKNKFPDKNLEYLDNYQIGKDEISLISNDLYNATIQESIDFVYSKCVFEHIKEIGKNIEKLSELMPKGSIMWHRIDFSDHYHSSYPFLFLKYSKNTWEKYCSRVGISYTNRLRYSDFENLFESNGFEILNVEIIKKDIPKDLVISEEFVNYDKEKLKIVMADFFLRKQ